MSTQQHPPAPDTTEVDWTSDGGTSVPDAPPQEPENEEDER